MRYRSCAVALLALVPGCKLRRMDLTSDRVSTVPLLGVKVIRVTAGAGWLRIEGHGGFTQMRAHGTAHGSTPALLEQVKLDVTRAGDTLVVVGSVPADGTSVGQPAALDLTLDVPDDLALDVDDQSGETIIRDVGPLRIRTGGSGGLSIDGVNGPLDVRDGPGDMEALNIRGDVHIMDGAGNVYITNVHGSVFIPTDGSGEIQLAEVTGNVTIGPKTSGDVSVRNIDGDLSVAATGDGSVEFHDVRGHVKVPRGRALQTRIRSR